MLYRLLAWMAAALALVVVPASAQPSAIQAQVTIHADQPGPQISRYIYGQFAEHLGSGIYDGIWVGPNSNIPNTRGIRNDVVTALRALHVPVVRWPGGCFADTYHWRDGVGPAAQRPVTLNKTWGNVEESNAFGTHEYFDFLSQIGSDAYVTADVGS
ncbi:MAG: alpha-N-arabinofuranosidase, partial [Pseudomonadota bacterium]